MPLLQYLLKFSISLTVLYIFYRAVLRPLTFYRWNRFYLLGYSLFSFAIPFINITPWMPEALHSRQLVNMVPVIGNYAVAGGSAVVTASAVQGPVWQQWLLMAFGLGAIVIVVRLILQYLSLKRIRSKAVLLENTGPVLLYQTGEPVSPFSFGNAIYFNSSLHTEEELQRIIRHEFVHVKQKHSVDIMMAELLCIVNWFNPFAWLIRHAIRQNLEFIADHEVVSNGVDRKEYQYLLLKVVGIPQYSIANNFNFSNLKKRIAMMNKMKSAKLQLTKFLFVLPLLAVLLLAFRNDHRAYAMKVKRAGPMNAVIATSTGRDNDTIPAPTAPSVPAAMPPAPAAPPPPPRDPALPENVTAISTHRSFNKKKNINVNTVTLTLNNGTKETYNLNEPKEKEAYEKKYGELPEVVPVRAPAEPLPPVSADAAPAFNAHITDKPSPVYVLDGTVLETTSQLDRLDPADIESIRVLKDSAADKYGDKGKNGVVELTTRRPLYIINGSVQRADADPSKLNPVLIKSKNILNAKEATDKYGQRAAHGAVEIELKEMAGPPISANVLLIIDGREMPPGTKVEDVVKKEEIESVEVYQGIRAIIKYGEKGKYNVIELKTKRYQPEKKGQITIKGDKVVFNKNPGQAIGGIAIQSTQR